MTVVLDRTYVLVVLNGEDLVVVMNGQDVAFVVGGTVLEEGRISSIPETPFHFTHKHMIRKYNDFCCC